MARKASAAHRELPFSTEEQALLRKHPTLDIPLPAYRGQSLANLAVSLRAATASRAPGSDGRLPPLDRTLDPFGGGRAEGPVVLVLVDGLGWRALRESAARAPGSIADCWVRRGRPLTTVFPTTTAVVLTSLTSGAAPAQHGVVGHRVYLPRFGTVVEMLRMSPLGVASPEALVGPDWSPGLISGVRTMFREGVEATAISRERFEGTGFTRLIYDGATYLPYLTGSDLALALVDTLARDQPPPLVIVYRDDLDVLQHRRGYRSDVVDLEVERSGSLLAFVAKHLPVSVARRTRVLVTGDHGQVPLETDHQVIADREPELLQHLIRPPSGDRRATFLAAKPGHSQALRSWLAARTGPAGHLLEMPAAVDAGLFGPTPHHPELPERLGDFLWLLPSPGGVSYTPPGAHARGYPMLAAHGGLEPPELLVPLVRGTLEEFGRDPSPPPHRRARHGPVRPR